MHKVLGPEIEWLMCGMLLPTSSDWGVPLEKKLQAVAEEVDLMRDPVRYTARQSWCV